MATSTGTSTDTGTPARVVIVDDAPEVRAMLRVVLQVDGRIHVVGEAADGAEGVRVVYDTWPDAVVLDVRMSGMDGLAAIPEIQRSAPHTKIVVYAGDGRAVRAAADLGVQAVQSKATPVADLVETVLAVVHGDAPPAQ